MDIRKLLLRIFLLSAATLGVVLIIIFLTENGRYAGPVLIGWLISLANAIAGSFVLDKALREKGKGFINIVLGSLVIRIFAVVGIMFAMIYFLKIEKFSLAISMFFFYVMFLVLELKFISAAGKEQKSLTN